ncbi:MAG: collagen-binding domain-containing protein, partial [Ruminococcus sp.]
MKTKKHRLLSSALAAIVAASQVVTSLPSIRASADVTNGCTSGNPVDNLSANSSDQITDVDLLVGHGHALAANANSVDQVISNANATYFLGIASQFAVFLDGDMNVTAADSEGRNAVKGNFTFTGGYNYQAGDGDYGTSTPLGKLEEYQNVTNFAHLIVGGEKICRANVRDYKGSSDWKEIAVSDKFSLESSNHMVDGSDAPYSSSCSHVSGGDELAHFWKSNAFDENFFNQQFSTINERSNAVLAKAPTGTVTISGDSITFDAGENCTDKVIYFK